MEVQKLCSMGFISAIMYSKWLDNIVLVKKKKPTERGESMSTLPTWTKPPLKIIIFYYE